MIIRQNITWVVMTYKTCLRWNWDTQETIEKKINIRCLKNAVFEKQNFFMFVKLTSKLQIHIL